MTGSSRSGTSESYQYYPGGTRVWKSRIFSSDSFGIFYLYGPGGQLLAERESLSANPKDYVYFGGRLLYSPAGTVYRDRLGSARVTGTPTSGYTTRNYYPFGEEIGAMTAGNQYKFADTYRDSTSGLDYAMQRYYASGTGRFLRPDPYIGRMEPADPESFNLYSYVGGDPVNPSDPSGLFLSVPTGCVPTGDGRGIACGSGGVVGGILGSESELPANLFLAHPSAADRGDGPPDPPYNPRADFRDYARQLSNDARKSDCEKLALMANKAGQVSRNADNMVARLQSGLTEYSGRGGASDPNYRVGVFRSDPYYEKGFLDSGFAHQFQDSSNQVRHFAGWFAAGFLLPAEVAN